MPLPFREGRSLMRLEESEKTAWRKWYERHTAKDRASACAGGEAAGAVLCLQEVFPLELCLVVKEAFENLNKVDTLVPLLPRGLFTLLENSVDEWCKSKPKPQSMTPNEVMIPDLFELLNWYNFLAYSWILIQQVFTEHILYARPWPYYQILGHIKLKMI